MCMKIKMIYFLDLITLILEQQPPVNFGEWLRFVNFRKETVINSLSQLATTDYVNTQLTSSNVLDKQIQIIISELHLKIPQSFLSILNLIREITGANMLMSVYSTNWKFVDKEKGSEIMQTVSLEYEGCNCRLSSRCMQSSRGMMAGCYPLKALLQSTLHCFYDQQCLDPNGNFQN
jgi:hypothetical protein